jgi:hypothetical protein
VIARCTAVGYRRDLRQRAAEHVTGGSGSSRRTPTSLPCSQTRCITYPFGSSSDTTAAGNVIPAACSSANGSASSPAWRSCGPRTRDPSRDGQSTAIMRPGQANDTSPDGPIWFVVNSARVLVAVDASRSAIREPRSPLQYPRSSHPSYAFSFGARRPEQQCARDLNQLAT